MKQSNFKLLSRALEAEVEPMKVFEACKSISDKNYRVLLESSEQGTNGNQQSMLLLGQALKIEARGSQVTISALSDNGQAAVKIIRLHLSEELLSDEDEGATDNIKLDYPDSRMIEEESERVQRLTSLDAIRQILTILSKDDTKDAEKLLVAGVAGFDYVDSLEVLPSVPSKADDFPDYIFLLSDNQIIIDQRSNRIEIRQIIFSGQDSEFRLGQARAKINAIEEILKTTDCSLGSELDNFSKEINPTASVDVYPEAESFKSDVLKIKDAIAKGQVFQAVISRNFSLDCRHPTLAYQFLKQQNPSPYQFYLELGDYLLFGASPESSLRYQQKQRAISIMPIAGTRGRGRNSDGSINEELDARLEADLKLDEKELAEHLMLVDLARNDLARIAETGSRKVRELMSVYRYSAVMHMVSRIEAKLHKDLDIYHACQSCFHMGTLTGAPKREAMKLIRQIEQRRRGAYGGAVGYFTAAGDMDTAIVIRSALVNKGKATITAGAGIVADSTPENELEETVLKSAAVIRAIQHSEQANQSIKSGRHSDVASN